MSKLGFNRDIINMRSAQKRFLRVGMSLAQKEFKRNFDGEKNSETGQQWDDVVRGVPPPILDDTGELKGNTLSSGNVSYTSNSDFGGTAVLTVDPIDKRGRGYAQYHQDGIGVTERAFITQSNDLTNEQESLLISLTDKSFKTTII